MNAPPFELVGIGFLVIGFGLISIFLFGAVIVYVAKEGLKRIR
jgi:hypothetical protein